MVPDHCIIGEVNGGFELIMLAINLTRIHLGGIYVGMGDELRDLGRDYAKQRKTFGRRLGDHEAIQFMLADIDCELEASRLLVYAAADAVDNNRSDMRIAASRAKLFASKMAFRTADRALQIYGAADLRRCGYQLRFFHRAHVSRLPRIQDRRGHLGNAVDSKSAPSLALSPIEKLRLPSQWPMRK